MRVCVRPDGLGKDAHHGGTKNRQVSDGKGELGLSRVTERWCLTSDRVHVCVHQTVSKVWQGKGGANLTLYTVDKGRQLPSPGGAVFPVGTR